MKNQCKFDIVHINSQFVEADGRISDHDPLLLQVSPKQVDENKLKVTLVNKNEFKPGDDAKITISAQNNTNKKQKVTLIIVVYSENFQMLAYAGSEKELEIGEIIDLNGIIKLPKIDGIKVKGLVWDDITKMNILSNVIE